MRKGETIEGEVFFQLLDADDEFCKELGKAVLAAGKLEAELIRYINRNNVGEKTNKANLGKLIFFARKHELLAKMVPALEIIKDQRNYLTHNIYSLFSGLVEETILPKYELLDSDVDVFTVHACQLKENINEAWKRVNLLKQELAQEKLTQSRLEREYNTAKGVYSVLSQKNEEVKIAVATESGLVKIASLAYEPRFPIKPNKKLNILIAGVLGLFVGIFVAFFLEFWQKGK